MALAAALAVRGPRLGHVCVDLATIAATASVDTDEPVDLAALEDLVLRVARLADDLPEVLRLTLEPVIVGPPNPWHGGRSLVVAGGTGVVGPPTARVDPGPRRMRSPV